MAIVAAENECSDAKNTGDTGTIRHYSTKISRVNLKYQNYDTGKVEAVKETTVDYDTFYQAAILLLHRMSLAELA